MARKQTKTNKPTTPKGTAKDAIAKKVLNLLLAKLKAGVNAWKKPWDSKGNPTADPRFFAVNLFTGKPYSGINCATLEAGFYAGFSQITANGGKIKKGSKTYPVVWFGSFEKDLDEAQQQAIWDIFDVNESKPSKGKYGDCYKFAPNFYEVYNVYLTEDCDLEKVTKVCKVLKTENVFSIEDTEGLGRFVDKFWAQFKGEEKSKIFDANEKGDLWIDAYCTGAKLRGFYHNGGNSSYYSPADDTIHLAKKTAYFTPAEYYSTAFHEMTHSTGAASRLNRDGIVKFDRFGSPRYAKEELIAEMGAAMAMGFLGIDTDGTNDNSAAYLGNWLHQKIGEKASEEALKTMMAASSSAKFAFAYIAEFYETAKAHKEEENNKKKTEEPKAMLPAVVLPKPEAARAYKAEPKAAELAQLSDYEIAVRISVASQQGDDAYLAALQAEKERRYQATKAEKIDIIDAASIGFENGFRFRGCYFPGCNKLDRLEGYLNQITTEASIRAKKGNLPDDLIKAHAEEFSAWNVAIVEKIIQLDGEAYREFCNNLLKDRAYLAGIGGSQLVNIDTLEDAEMPEGVEYYDHKRLHQMRLAWATVCVMVNNKDGKEAILVDPEGFEYARYVGFMPESMNIEAPEAEAPQMSDAALDMVKTIKEHLATNPNEVPTEGATLFDLIDFGNSYKKLKEDKLFAEWLEQNNLAMTLEKGFCTSFRWQRRQACYRAMPTAAHDPDHYNDGMIDVRDIPEFYMMVFTNSDGKTASVSYDSNFFYPGELVRVYKTLWEDGWNMEDEKADYIEAFRQWMLATGAKPEDLEGE